MHRFATLLLPLLLTNLPAKAADNSEEPTPGRFSLNGMWQFSMHGQGQRLLRVPSTYLPVGAATLERAFDLPVPPTDRRVLLRFDGIVTTGVIFVNGQQVGEFGPYTPFAIDVTGQVKAGRNLLRVDLSDLGGFEPWGRNWVTAFPRFGGIIRDVSFELKSPVYIENSRLDYSLSSDYTQADCRLQVWVINTRAETQDLELAGSLSGGDSPHRFTARIQAGPGKSLHTIPFQLSSVRLWSPDSPQLYRLSLSLRQAREPMDQFTALTGFREFVARGRDFYLNGKKLFLKGLFRHDIYGDQGHTMTRSQMEAEMADIKSLGCNFVRLGHYPHHAYIVELAARQGLLASGEPPIFGLNQRDAKVVEGAKFCLGGLIQRDWNNPAVVAWFISNEAGTDPGYMKEMAAFVRSLDPTRLVSIVDNTRWTEQNLPWTDFRAAGINFIAQNTYGAALDGYYTKIEKFLPDDLPYVISEWGGPKDYTWLLREGQFYLDHSNLKISDGPRIAGISFWEYQDIPMPRWEPEGLLHWSLVDKFRRPYEAYYALKTLYTGVRALPPRGRVLADPMPEQLPRPLGPGEGLFNYEPIDLSSVVNSDHVFRSIKPISPLAFPEHLPLGAVGVAGLPFLLHRQVIALSRETPSVRIPVGKAASEIEFLGHVCFNSLATKPPQAPRELPYYTEGFPHVENPPPFKGYPQAGEFGEIIGEYLLIYEDGEAEPIELRNGIHFADYRQFYGLSMINPIATATERVVSYKAEFGHKLYQLRLYSHRPAKPATRIEAIEFTLKNLDYVPLLVGLTIRRYDPDVDKQPQE